MAKTLKLSDYKKSNYLIPDLDLSFDLFEDHTIVINKMTVLRNPDSEEADQILRLNGEKLELLSVKMNDKTLESSDYKLSDKLLEINGLQDSNQIEITTKIYPHKNTSLEGLYKTGKMFCTQNEAEGFHKITYFLDRPDIMSSYNCSISASKEKYPILLSNGDCVHREELENGRHMTKWHDPHKKPCYLFALVAGDLCFIKDKFTTKSGRNVSLEIYSEYGTEDKLDYAMQALKDSMKWDEERFDLEYDLDTYMIVAASDFNAGAMENKGLNIFNTKYVLANRKTATDTDFYGIQSVIGHEYFHNWTGNRVTCRDWFQLSLKEGLTVFRDQEFSGDLNSKAVERIYSVIRLRSHQFAEDAGPTAHPIRPEQVISMNNFYTLTVYEKGAEVIRMMHTLLGEEKFQKAMKLYFERHDGTAATCEDFVSAMEDASGTDLKQFRNWYSQAGTPEVKAETKFIDGKFTISLEQKCGPSPGQENKKDFHIPIVVGFLNSNGNELNPNYSDSNITKVHNGYILNLKNSKQEFVFTDFSSEPKLSINRHFSTPIRLNYQQSDEDLSFLAQNDNDYFNRWEAIFNIAKKDILRIVEDVRAKTEAKISENLINAYKKCLELADTDPSFVALAISLPDQKFMRQLYVTLPSRELIEAYKICSHQIAKNLESELKSCYDKMSAKAEDKFGLEFQGEHSLQSKCLEYLNTLNNEEYAAEAKRLINSDKGMTMEVTGLNALKYNTNKVHFEDALNSFYEKWNSDKLVLNKFFQFASSTESLDSLEHLKSALNKPEFSIKTPNSIYSTLGIFSTSLAFHAIGKEAYDFYTDKLIEVDKINPSVAARLASGFNDWKRQIPENQDHLKQCLEKIIAAKVSDNTFEIIDKCLKA